MFDNLNSLLLDIFKESRLSGEKYSSILHEIEAVSTLYVVTYNSHINKTRPIFDAIT